MIEPDVRLRPHDIVAPDLVGWRRERMPNFPRARPIDILPDWICEVLSPRYEKRDRVTKADLYLEVGVPFYWILDVHERTLEAFASRDRTWLRLGGWTDGAEPRIPPFEAITIEVGALYPPPQEDA